MLRALELSMFHEPGCEGPRQIVTEHVLHSVDEMS